MWDAQSDRGTGLWDGAGRDASRRRPQPWESAASSSDDSDDDDDDDEGGADSPPASASSSSLYAAFERAMVRRTREYYTARADEYRSAHGVPAYLDWVLRVLDTEAAVASLLPTAASRRCVHRVVRSSLLGAHRAAIEAEVEPLLRADDHAALRQLYERLRCLPDGVSHIESVLRRHILSTAADALGAVEEARGDGGEAYVSAFVAAALAVHDRFEALIHEVFDEDDGPDGGRGGALSTPSAPLLAVLAHACESYLNAAAGGAAPLLLARYFDGLLVTPTADGWTPRRPDAVPSEARAAEVEAKLHRATRLLRHLHERDIFANAYQEYLGRRLLTATSAGLALEQVALSLLQPYTAAEQHSKLKRMVSDCLASAEFITVFDLSLIHI